LLAANYSIIW